MSKKTPAIDPVPDLKLSHAIMRFLPELKKTALQQGDAFLAAGNYGCMASLKHHAWLCVALATAYPTLMPGVYQIEADLTLLATKEPFNVIKDEATRLIQAKHMKKLLQSLRKKWRDVKVKQDWNSFLATLDPTLRLAFQSLSQNAKTKPAQEHGAIATDMWSRAGLGDDEDEDDPSDGEAGGTLCPDVNDLVAKTLGSLQKAADKIAPLYDVSSDEADQQGPFGGSSVSSKICVGANADLDEEQQIAAALVASLAHQEDDDELEMAIGLSLDVAQEMVCSEGDDGTGLAAGVTTFADLGLGTEGGEEEMPQENDPEILPAENTAKKQKKEFSIN